MVRRDTRWPGADPTDEGAVAGGGRVTAPGVAGSFRRHPKNWDSGPVAPGHPGPLVTRRTLDGGRGGAQPTRGRWRCATSGGAASGRYGAPAPPGSGIPRRSRGGVHCRIGRVRNPGSWCSCRHGSGGGLGAVPRVSGCQPAGTFGSRLRYVLGAPSRRETPAQRGPL